MVEKGSTNLGKAPPPFWAMPERKHSFLQEVPRCSLREDIEKGFMRFYRWSTMSPVWLCFIAQKLTPRGITEATQRI